MSENNVAWCTCTHPSTDHLPLSKDCIHTQTGCECGGFDRNASHEAGEYRGWCDPRNHDVAATERPSSDEVALAVALEEAESMKEAAELVLESTRGKAYSERRMTVQADVALMVCGALRDRDRELAEAKAEIARLQAEVGQRLPSQGGPLGATEITLTAISNQDPNLFPVRFAVPRWGILETEEGYAARVAAWKADAEKRGAT